MNESFLVVIPALDAEPYVGGVVESCRRTVPELEVVVVNDGSRDRTAEVAQDSGARILTHSVNLGKGAALKTGFRYALDRCCDAVITLDADGQHLPSEIPRFIATYQDTNADLIIGSRSHLFHGMVGRRRAANRFSAWSISRTAGVAIDDSQSGFRLYSARLLRAIPIRAEGFAAESEVIVRAGRGGFRIVSIPIDLGFVNGISTSHYRPVLDTLRIAGVVAKTRIFG